MAPAAYARKMRTGSDWGGAIEIAVCASLKGVNVPVSEAEGPRSYRRISQFGQDGASRTVSVVYGGRCHYDALVP